MSSPDPKNRSIVEKKDKALAEVTAIMVLKKNLEWITRRGQLNMKTTQDTICEAIVEAQAAYLSLKRISEVTGISIRTLQRWMQQSSEDNPFSESLFKTLKYRPGYPGKFQSLNEARNWVANFVYWYNCEHRNRLCNARTTR